MIAMGGFCLGNIYPGSQAVNVVIISPGNNIREHLGLCLFQGILLVS